MVLSSMGCLSLRRFFWHLFIFLFATSSLSLELTEKLAEEPENYSDAVPLLWHSAPGNLGDYPVNGSNILINPWSYPQRLGLYKILLKATSNFFAPPGPNDADNNVPGRLPQQHGLQYISNKNILWGLALQHGWQYSTGRLEDPTNITRCGKKDGDNLCISERSWWACMNYYLAIVPFLGALESGIFGDLADKVEILPPNEQRADFCHSVAECNAQAPKAMAGWRDFFKYLSSTALSSEAPEAQEAALNYMWKAHVHSLAYGRRKFKNRLPYLSGPESNFGEDWAATVDFIAATHFHTDQETTNRLQTGLPPRMLLEGEKAPFIADFTPEQNKVLFLFGALSRTNEKTGNLLLLIWKAAMATEGGREIGRKLIESVI
ncbi:protein LEG1 homolog [Podarcis raffonei]|uniref:protein LEG1 homolog n=1 Tax=Podarcis raffonei TaxID=65483 RepID=UPI002329715B|nr:protein LEG1 homolog [Podarcis raffonei]